MKTLILSLNSKYIHTLLAPRYLKANCSADLDVHILESNINVNINETIADIYNLSPDILAISCYIFNIEYVRKVIEEITLIMPSLIIILGGYEAAFDVERYAGSVNYIIKGEGDFIFNELIHDIANGTHKFPQIIEAGTVCELDSITSPYTQEYSSLGAEKILYFESTRGCPFSCSYCMSANTRGVRTFSLERIKRDLSKIMEFSPKQIKFVDRTFNFDMARATKIFQFIIENFSASNTNFHCEMAPELFNDEMFAVIAKAPKGLIQFEIGVQSYNPETLISVGRHADIAKIESNIAKLVALNNVHIHVDLIAGLPYENYVSFVAGFNRLFNLKADCLQLGFLKILKGSLIYNNKGDYVVRNTPPYEIISSAVLPYSEILQLKIAEEMLELYHNSARFAQSINFLIPTYFEGYAFFYGIGKYLRELYKDRRKLSAYYQCDVLYDYAINAVALEKGSKEYNNFCLALEKAINSDYEKSGNIRKWRRNI